MTAARKLTDDTLLVTLTRAELLDVVREAVREEAIARAEEWIDADAVAKLLGVERSTVPTLVSRDKLPAARVGRVYRFKRAAVLAWLEDRATRSGGHAERHGATLRALKRSTDR